MLGDCELMMQVAGGDVQAFEVLVNRHRDRVRDFVYRLCWDWEEAADCAQEAFIRLWRRRAEYVPRTQFTTYLYTIARSCWLDHRRRRDSRPRTIPLDAQIGPAAERLLAEMIQRAEPTVEAVLRRYEVHQIRQALARLPDAQRSVFILSHFEDLRYAQPHGASPFAGNTWLKGGLLPEQKESAAPTTNFIPDRWVLKPSMKSARSIWVIPGNA